MTAPITTAELREIEERMEGVLDYGAQDGPYLRSDTNLLLYEDIPRLVATVRALRVLLTGLAWSEQAIDDALAALASAEAAP